MRSLAQFDPDIKRPYSQALNFGITHELVTGLSVAAEYYRIDFKNITMRLNSLLNADSYNRFEVANPLGGDNVPVWVIKPEFRGQVANIDSTSDDMKRNYNGLDINFNARIRGGVRAFGGFNLERSINDVCVSAQSDPNRSLYCDQGDSGIPWQKQFKATVVYPLPFWGISASAALQSLNGYLVGTAAQAYGGFTAGTGFDNPRGQGTFLRDAEHGDAAGRPPCGADGRRPGQRQRADRGAGDRVHPAHQPDGLLVQQEGHLRPRRHAAEDRLLQRLQLRRLLVGGDGAVRRANLPAAFGGPAGPHHPRWRGCDLVGA